MVEKAGASAGQAERVLALAGMTGSNAEILDRLEQRFGGNAKAAEGIGRLRELLDVASTAGMPEERLRLDLSIARGLDYYTGTIYETFLLDMPEIGSVCSGGRTTTWPACTRSSSCPASAPRWAWTGCWPRWRS